jgi:hypothetical protein
VSALKLQRKHARNYRNYITVNTAWTVLSRQPATSVEGK